MRRAEIHRDKACGPSVFAPHAPKHVEHGGLRLLRKTVYGKNSDIFVLVQSGEYDKVIGKLKELKTRAGGKNERGSAIQDAIDRVEEMKNGDIRLEIRE